MQYSLRVNGKTFTVDVDSQKPLLWVLREDLGLTGTKYSCGIGLCGSCSVLLDGESVESCLLPVGDVGEREVTTIEGLTGTTGKALKAAWTEEQVSQCGYCQPGQLIKAASLLKDNPDPTETDICAAMTNLCRCGTYQRIKRAVSRAADALQEGDKT
jgi:isoquinoline 1-oxidoreductase alpha subunit